MFGKCPGILPYFMSREFLDSVVFSSVFQVDGILLVLLFLFLFVFYGCRCLYCRLYTCSLAVCVLVGFNSKQENERCQFSFASLSCIQFCRLHVDSINYKKLAFGSNQVIVIHTILNITE